MAELVYKKITDVDQIETLQNGSSVFVNNGGSLKQIDVANTFATKEHADQHNWSNTLTWDGDTTGRMVVSVSGPDDYDNYCLVSDVVPTLDDLANGYSGVYQDNDGAEAYPYYMTFEEIDDGGWVYPGGGVYAYDFVIVPTDNYTFTGLQGPPTFPNKGIYFGYWSDGWFMKSLTIPDYVFKSGNDAITPDMIGAAPAYHTATDIRYGVSTGNNYGHSRLAELAEVNGTPGLFRFNENNELIDKDGNIVEEPGEYFNYCATGAYFSYAFYMIMSLEIEALRAEIAELRGELEALKGE